MKRIIGAAGAIAFGLGIVMAAPAQAAPQAAGTGNIFVPDDFVESLSDTRATGHYELVDDGLRIWTEGSTGTDKVAEYVATNAPLAGVGEPTLDYTNTSGGGVPGFQLVVDFDGTGGPDGILVGEPGVPGTPGAYGNDWWLSNGSAQFAKDGAPSHTGGFGSANHGTLDQWRTAFPHAVVKAFGFSLGSGVKGDGVITAINFAGTRYALVERVVLTGVEQCKKDGWATSNDPVFKNQGACVSSFVSNKNAAKK